MTHALDHLLYAVPDLAAGIDALEARTGVRAVYGGRHLRWGTHNALLALGGDAYLELIAPDPHAQFVDFAALRGLAAPRLWSWAVRSADLHGAVAAAGRHGVDLGAVSAGQRTRDDGVVLHWQLTDPAAERAGGLVPFFIDWGTTPHPAQTAPPGCTLADLRVVHPHPERLRALFDALGVPVTVMAGAPPTLRATIDTPRGSVVLE